jgi:hypothetical protein
VDDEIRIPLTEKQHSRLQNLQQNVAMVTALRDNAFALLVESETDLPLEGMNFQLTAYELIARPNHK